MALNPSSTFTYGSVDGTPSSLRKRIITFTADENGDAGETQIDNFFGRLAGVALTEVGLLSIVDAEDVDLLNGYTAEFTGRLTFTVPNPVVGTIKITLNGLPANAEGKVVLYAYDE